MSRKPIAPPPVPLNRRIELAAWKGLERKIPGIPIEEWYCLKFIRLCVEYAMGLRDRGFYTLVVGVDSNPTANKFEQLLKTQRPTWFKPLATPGDLVWWYDQPKNWGHVGIAVQYKGELWVAQNTLIKKLGIDYPGALRLVRLVEMGKPSSVVRIGG